MDQHSIYRDIAERCGGDIYIGVVGPVRTGKSSFIKRFMELMVLPEIEDENERTRMRDELPQSGAGRTVMTNQPKFVPNEAVRLHLKDASEARVRLVDCVGYLVDGALGTQEDEADRMVRTPWFDHDIPFEQAAEIGTRKVIAEHSTVGIVVTTDGSVTEMPRSAYEAAEARAVSELKALGKPFIVVLNSAQPQSADAQVLEKALGERYAVPVMAADVENLREEELEKLLECLLFEFPIRELFIAAPSWLTSLPEDHWLGGCVLTSIRSAAENMRKMGDHAAVAQALSENEYTGDVVPASVSLNDGSAEYSLRMQDGLFYRILGEACGQEIEGEEHLFALMKRLVRESRAYEKLEPALRSVEQSGYGVVLPDTDELALNPPQIAKEGSHFGVRLSADAPSLHLIRVDLKTDVSPIVGTEKQSRDLLESLAAAYKKDPAEVWDTEVFGKPLRELVRDEMHAKLVRMPDDVRGKLCQSLGKIINEGTGGMICILL